MTGAGSDTAVQARYRGGLLPVYADTAAEPVMRKRPLHAEKADAPVTPAGAPAIPPS